MNSLAGTTLLDRYFLRDHLGSGGMADVYLAWDRLRSTKMAVKVLRRDLAETPRFFQMFAKEAELLRKLEHPNIVRLYEFEKDGDVIFIVMDWIEGINLRQAINSKSAPMSLGEVWYILQPVCSALHYAHQSCVYHCDVKPQNILLHTDGRVFLTDFGVARLASENIGGGTPPYMAPEQFSGGDINAKSDIYSLGITLYEMLTGGQLPYRGESPSSQGSTPRERIAWEHLNLPLPSLQIYNPSLPQPVERVVFTALSKDPSIRYSTTLALREAFESAIGGTPQEDKIRSTNLPQIHPRAELPPRRKEIISDEQPPQKPTPFQPSGVNNTFSQLPSTADQFRRLIKSIRSQIPTPGNAGSVPGTGQAREVSANYLFGRVGDWTMQRIPIPKTGLTIGRSAQCHLRLSEASVSRLHATIIQTKRGVYIRDENSSMGTLVNTQRIVGPVKLKHGDVIQIGYSQVFEFRER